MRQTKHVDLIIAFDGGARRRRPLQVEQVHYDGRQCQGFLIAYVRRCVSWPWSQLFPLIKCARPFCRRQIRFM